MSPDPRVELFGSVTCVVDGRDVPVPPGKPSLFLAMLALEAGTVVRTSALVDGLWGPRPPATARALVHTYISTLRKALAVPGGPGVETLPGGYRLRLDPSAVDLHRFLAAAAAPKVDDESVRLIEVSARPLLGGVDSTAILPWQMRVDAARAGLQDRVWARSLDEGAANRVLPGLEAAVRDDPLREDRVLLLARALDQQGRAGEALAALDSHRRTLAAELGLDPSPQAVLLRQQILERPAGSLASAPAADGERHPDARLDPRPRQPGRRAVAAAAVAIVGVGVAGLAAWAVRRDDGLEVTGSALLEVDPDAGVMAVVNLPVSPSQLDVAGARLWVTSAAGRAVAWADWGDPRGLRVIGLDQSPSGLAVDRNTAVVGLGFSGDIVVVDEDGASAPRPAVPGEAGRVTLASGSTGLWVATIVGDLHAPPDTRGWPTPVSLARSPLRMSVDSRHTWVLTSAPSELVASDSSIEPPTVSPLRGEAVDVTSAGGHAWVVTANENRLWHASPEGARVVGTILLPGPPAAIAVLRDRVWVAITEPPSLVAHERIGLQQRASTPLPRRPVDLAVSDGRLIVAVT